MRALVVGGGIGGMATAIALEQVGIEPVVLEQAPVLEEIGSGIGMHPNAMRVLERLGAADYVRETGVRIDYGEWRRMDNGEPIYSQPFTDMKDIYGDVYICMHRADLHDSLIMQVPAERVTLGAKLVGLEQHRDGVVAQLSNGDEVHGDVMIGADGLRSNVRTILFGEQEARFTGYAAWRGLISADDMPPGFEHKIVTWPGQGRHGMTYPIRPNLVTFNGFVPSAEIHREEWGPSGDMHDMLSSFDGMTEDMMQIVRLISTALITPIYFRDPLPIWGTERITLLGDAAHPTPPSAGQGGAMALEDAVTLAACLRRAEGGTAGISAALAEFAARRQARTAGMLTAARVNLNMFNEPDPVQQRARDGRLRGMLQMDPTGEIMYGWLYGHDAIGAAEEPLPAHVVSGQVMKRDVAQRAYHIWRDALHHDDRSNLWVGEREGYARFTDRAFPNPDGVTVEQVNCDRVPALKVVPPAGADDSVVVLHLHGGGYTMGSAKGSVELASRLAAAVGGWALVPEYRLAPENAFPAALDDVFAAYRWLERQPGVTSVLVTGECAGGGLAVSLAMRLRDAGLRLPNALNVFSPFADLTLTSQSANASPPTDPWFNRARLRLLAASYIDTTDPAEPLVSPARGDLRGLPALMIHAAAGEALVDDATLLAQTARDAGVDVTLNIVEDSVHSFVLFDFLPETDVALNQFAQHVDNSTPHAVS